MGEVYRAKDTRLDRDVAVKILPAGSVGNAQAEARFDREARAIAALSHQNICTLHDVGRLRADGASASAAASADKSASQDGGPPHPLTTFTDKNIVDFAWSPDGKRLAMTRGRIVFDIVLMKGIR